MKNKLKKIKQSKQKTTEPDLLIGLSDEIKEKLRHRISVLKSKR